MKSAETDNKEHEVHNELLGKSELSIWLDDYDDVFSDFDPRPLDERSLSDDFLNEVKKMIREKPDGKVQLKLLIPSGKRKKEKETVVIKNLHTYFTETAVSVRIEIRKTRRQGILLTVVGLLLMVATAYVISLQDKTFLFNALQVVLEPAGWFMAWTGLDTIFYNVRRRKPQVKFNLKMADAEISFLSY